MAIEFCAVGGYGESGRNMSALKVDDNALILDMGFFLQKIADFEEEGGDRKGLNAEQMIKLEGIPNDNVISSWKNNIKGIFASHCHLDHMGAIPYLAPKYNAPIVGTPFTLEVLKTMMRDDNFNIGNKLKNVNPGKTYKINKDIKVEFIKVTHSTLQTSLIAVHTKKGIILYANDFKLDNHPVIGDKVDYNRLKELSQIGIKALILDSIPAPLEQKKTPSELVAREMLKEVMLEEDNNGRAIVVTCFASHIARLRSIIDFSHKLGRKVVILGRSFMKYIKSAENIGLVSYSKEAEIIPYKNQIKRRLRKLEKDGLSDYVIIATGGQGERSSVLSRMLHNELPFEFMKEDSMIFSNRVIPVEPNITNRALMEKKFIQRGLRIFTNVHTSGHCGKEDLRDLIKILNPENIIPCQGDVKLQSRIADLAREMGYNHKRVHVLKNSQKITLG